jgi:hypothetical protein
MGTGSSRNQVTIETVNHPDDVSSDVVITREKRPPIRQSTIQKTVTETEPEVGKFNQDGDDDATDVISVHSNNELEDIHDLEQTFDSLGIPSTSELISDQINIKNSEKPLDEPDLSPLKTKWSDVKAGVAGSQNSPERNSSTEGSDSNVGWGASRSFSGPQTRLDTPAASTLVYNNNNNTKSAPMKFKWSHPEPTKSPDEWIYRKVRPHMNIDN